LTCCGLPVDMRYTETVGFIGLGIMGRPMARNLIKAGFDLVVYNRSPRPMEELAAEGARIGGSPRDVAAGSDVTILMLPDSPDVESVMTGQDGVLEGLEDGKIVVDMSTISPVVARNMYELVRQKGASMLDAPVSGGDKGAISGTLSIMVGGDQSVFNRCLPIFQALGKTIVYVGPSGAGQIVKACNQIVVALVYEAVSEALVLGSKAGVDPARIVQVLSGGLAGNRVLELRGQSMMEHNFAPGFRVKLHHKDLGIALAAGRSFGVPLPVTALVDQMFEALIQSGCANLDHSALLTFIEGLAGHQIRGAEH
jgi:2-hydroxy-3-oxopropionate reductase